MVVGELNNISVKEGFSFLMDNGRAISIDDVVFYDIECATNYPSYNEIPPKEKALWDKKAAILQKFGKDEWTRNATVEELYEKEGGIFPTYSRIVAVSIGIMKNGKRAIVTYNGSHLPLEEQEEFIVRNVFALFNRLKKKYVFGASISRFDNGFLFKKGLKYGYICPPLLWRIDQKPWDSSVIDITEMWKTNSNARDVTLAAICHILGVESPKDGITGADVGRHFWVNKNYDGIAEYCEKDVNCYFDIFEKLSNLSMVL